MLKNTLILATFIILVVGATWCAMTQIDNADAASDHLDQMIAEHERGLDQTPAGVATMTIESDGVVYDYDEYWELERISRSPIVEVDKIPAQIAPDTIYLEPTVITDKPPSDAEFAAFMEAAFPKRKDGSGG